MDHCVAKIIAIVKHKQDDRRSLLQLGYNLGRLSERTGLGRGAFWDRWKGPVERWDLPELRRLACELPRPIDPVPTDRSPARGGAPSVGGR